MIDTDLQFGDYGAAVTVETGAGLSNADSYLSLAEATARIAQRGGAAAWEAKTEAEQNDMLRASAQFGIDAMFGSEWAGIRATNTQALDWPRIGARDRRRVGYAIASTEVPDGVKWVQVEYLMALLAGVNPLRMNDPAEDGGKAFAVSTSDSLPGGFNESRSFSGGGAPVLPVITRLNLAAWPLLVDRDRVVLS